MIATEPLQAVIDQQAIEIAALKDAVAALSRSVPPLAGRAVVRASELGCRVNEPAFDNAGLLQPLLDVGKGIEFDLAGLYYLAAPLRTKSGSASPLLGSSASWRFSPACTTGLAAGNPALTHLVEIPGVDPGGSGPMQIIRDLYFHTGLATSCDGVRVLGGDVVSIEACAFRNLRRGVLVEPVRRCYAPAVRACFFNSCGTGISLQNASSVCCFAAEACVLNGGAVGIFVDQWQRGAAFTGVVAEGQTDRCFWIRGGRASLRACYFESAETVPGLEVKASRLTIEDSSIHRFKKDSASEIEWRGQNAQGGTLDYGA